MEIGENLLAVGIDLIDEKDLAVLTDLIEEKGLEAEIAEEKDLVVEKGRAKRDPEVENVLLTTGTLRAEDILEKRRAHAMKRSLYPIKEARTLMKKEMKKEGVAQKTIEEMKEESPKEVGIEIASKQREIVRLLMKERKMKRVYRQKIRMLTKNLRSLKKRKLFGPSTRKNKSFVYSKLSRIY